MKDIDYSNEFNKDLKLVRKYPTYNEERLKNYIEALQNNEQLPKKCTQSSLKQIFSKEI